MQDMGAMGQRGRADRIGRGQMHRGHIVGRSTRGDRQQFKIETVAGAVYEVEDAQPAGYTSNPSASNNTEVVVAELGGESSRMVIIVKMGDSSFHLQVDEGAAALYSPDAPSNKAVVYKDGRFEINTDAEVTVRTKTVNLKSETANLDADNINLTGTVNIDGAVNINGDIAQTGSIKSTGLHDAVRHI